MGLRSRVHLLAAIFRKKSDRLPPTVCQGSKSKLPSKQSSTPLYKAACVVLNAYILREFSFCYPYHCCCILIACTPGIEPRVFSCTAHCLLEKQRHDWESSAAGGTRPPSRISFQQPTRVNFDIYGRGRPHWEAGMSIPPRKAERKRVGLAGSAHRPPRKEPPTRISPSRRFANAKGARAKAAGNFAPGQKHDSESAGMGRGMCHPSPDFG